MNGRITMADLLAAKQQRRLIAAVSCYDYTTACLVAQTPVDMILVGDSAAQMVLGFDSTLPITMDFMVAITAAVHRAAPNVYLVARHAFPILSSEPQRGDSQRRTLPDGGRGPDGQD